jgi:uncharacterized membrane protein YbaN (DUF454 family)
MKRAALIVVGWMFLLAGAAGLVLPIIPGIVFLLVGLSILSVEYAWARRWIGALRRRFPAADRQLQSMLSKVTGLTSA